MKFLGQEIPFSGFQTKYQDKDGREGHTCENEPCMLPDSIGSDDREQPIGCSSGQSSRQADTADDLAQEGSHGKLKQSATDCHTEDLR